MADVRALSVGGWPAAVGRDRPVRDRLGTFSPRPYEPPAQIVRSLHPLEQGPLPAPGEAAARMYLSNGLAAPDGVFRPLGWLIDVAA